LKTFAGSFQSQLTGSQGIEAIGLFNADDREGITVFGSEVCPNRFWVFVMYFAFLRADSRNLAAPARSDWAFA
jgi:hypothetical protein